MIIAQDLLDILACPVCITKVVYAEERAELACPTCRRVYPVRDSIPVMLLEEAKISEDVVK
jgi:uncharacterized protein YbaR (Trm112 family)